MWSRPGSAAPPPDPIPDTAGRTKPRAGGLVAPGGRHLATPAWPRGRRRRPTPPARRTRNWSRDNQALKRHGALTMAPGLRRLATPAGRQHRHQGRVRRRVARTQARRRLTKGLAQAVHRHRRENPADPSVRVHHERHRQRPHAARTARPDPAVARRSPPSSPAVPATPTGAMTPSPPALPPRSSRPAGTERAGGPTPPARSALSSDQWRTMPHPTTRSCGQRTVSAGPSGDDGAAVTPEAAPRPGCIATQPGQRLPARRFDRHVAKFQVRVAVLNGFTTLGISITEAVGWICPGEAATGPSTVSCNRAIRNEEAPLRLGFLSSKSWACLVEPSGIEPLTS